MAVDNDTADLCPANNHENTIILSLSYQSMKMSCDFMLDTDNHFTASGNIITQPYNYDGIQHALRPETVYVLALLIRVKTGLPRTIMVNQASREDW